jgi:DNA-binding NarL/FixJ family response regulator
MSGMQGDDQTSGRIIRVMLADDQPLLVDGLQRIVDSCDDMQVVAVAANGRQAVEQAVRTQPDVVLMDVRMPVLDGIEATRAIIDRCRQIRIVGLTSYDTAGYMDGMITAGANGFLLKDSTAERFIEAIRAVAAGNNVFADTLVRHIRQNLEQGDNQPDPQRIADMPSGKRGIPDGLSHREVQILGLITEGLTNEGIGKRLNITESTVKGHVRHLLAKLHKRSRTELVIWAYRNGFAR